MASTARQRRWLTMLFVGLGVVGMQRYLIRVPALEFEVEVAPLPGPPPPADDSAPDTAPPEVPADDHPADDTEPLPDESEVPAEPPAVDETTAEVDGTIPPGSADEDRPPVPGERETEVEHVVPAEPRPAMQFKSDAFVPYGGDAQQGPGTLEVSQDGREISLQGNVWRAVPLDYEVTGATVLEFSFRALAPGEVHAIGLTTDLTQNGQAVFQLCGTQAFGVQEFNNYAVDGSGTWQRYRIGVGRFLLGPVKWLAIVLDQDDPGARPDASFKDVAVYESAEHVAGADVGPTLPSPRDAVTLDEPIVLSTAGEVFTLDRDYRARRQAFIVAASNVTIDGAGHVVEFNTDALQRTHGIVQFVGWFDKELAQRLGLSTQLKPTKLTVKNLVLRAAVPSFESHGIGGRQLTNITVESCVIEARGKDSCSINEGGGSGKLTLRDNVLVCRVRETANRHQGPANVKSKAPVLADRNVLVGGNSGFNIPSGSVIRGNLIVHDSFDTNGYGIFTYRVSNCTLLDNVILPIDGRGILLNGKHAETPAAGNNRVTGNVILSRNRPNREFGRALNAAGIRLRYNSQDDTIAGNVLLAVGGEPYCGASGLYLSNTTGAKGTLVDNTVYAICMPGAYDRDRQAKALTLEGQYHAEHQIDGNRLFGNCHLISTSGFDGQGVHRRPLVGNTLGLMTGAEAVGAFLSEVAAKVAQIGLADVPAARQIVAQTTESLLPVTSAPVLPQASTLFAWPYQPTNSIPNAQRLTLVDSVIVGGAGLQASDVAVWESRRPGDIRYEVGSTVREPHGSPQRASAELVDAYWLGRVTGAGNEPITRQEMQNDASTD